MEESWKPVPGFGGHYEASSAGRVRSLDRFVRGKNESQVLKPGRIMTPSTSRHGYLYVCLRFDGQKRGMKVHRLVAYAFGIISGDEPINHINGDKSDNRPSNLEATTSIQNNRHAWRLGLRWDKGARHYRAKLTDNDVREIRELKGSGIPAVAIAEAYGVTDTTVLYISRGKTWRHVDASGELWPE